MITVFVPGKAIPKGSAKAMHHPGMKFPVVFQDNAADQKNWAKVIKTYAVMSGVKPADGAIALGLEFVLARPKGHFRANGTLKPNAPLWSVSKPDLDKLLRCAMDALTGTAYRDDNQVALFDPPPSKQYGEIPGVKITIRQIDALSSSRNEPESIFDLEAVHG